MKTWYPAEAFFHLRPQRQLCTNAGPRLLNQRDAIREVVDVLRSIFSGGCGFYSTREGGDNIETQRKPTGRMVRPPPTKNGRLTVDGLGERVGQSFGGRCCCSCRCRCLSGQAPVHRLRFKNLLPLVAHPARTPAMLGHGSDLPFSDSPVHPAPTPSTLGHDSYRSFSGTKRRRSVLATGTFEAALFPIAGAGLKP